MKQSLHASILTTILIAGLSTQAAFLLGACTSRPTEPVKTRMNKQVTIAQFGHLLLYLPLYIAQDKGFFKEQGLDVRIVSTGGDDKTFIAVSTGNAQFGVADPIFSAIARQEGRGGKVVASIVNGMPVWGVTFKDTITDIKQLADLKGLKLACYAAPSTSYAVTSNLLINHGNKIAAKIIQGQAPGSIIALARTKQADIGLELEPAVSVAVSQGARIVLSLQKHFGEFALTGLTVSDEYSAKNDETIASVVLALAKSMHYIHSDFEGTMAITKSEFPEVDETILRNALKRMLQAGTIPKTPVMSEEAWNNAVALRRQTGELKLDSPFSQSVELKFAQAAKEELDADQFGH